jgi:hypothetical protein
VNKYLDYQQMSGFLQKHFREEVESGATSVGVGRRYRSGYYDIVRFYGRGAVDPGDVEVRYIPGRWKAADPRIAEFTRIVEERLTAEGRLYEGPTITGLVDYDFAVSPPYVAVRETRYGDQAGTCSALDYPHRLFADSGGTLRQYYKSRYPSQAIKDSPLALCLGVCGLLLVEEHGTKYFLRVRRSGRLASLENSMGPSAAGSVDYRTGYRNFRELIGDSLGAEVREELGLGTIDSVIIPLAFAREIFRGESPQLFCLVRTSLTRQEVSSRLESLDAARREFDQYSFVALHEPPDTGPADVEGLGLNHEAAMNYCLMEEYLRQEA